MKHDEYENIVNSFINLNAAEIIDAMYHMTDEEGNLCIPALLSDYSDCESYYALKMEWNDSDVEKLKQEHKDLCSALHSIAQKGGCSSPETPVDPCEAKVWNTYLQPFNIEGMEVEEAKARIGGKYMCLTVILLAKRLCKLLTVNAPQVIINNETKMLAQAMAINQYAVGMEALPLQN